MSKQKMVFPVPNPQHVYIDVVKIRQYTNDAGRGRFATEVFDNLGRRRAYEHTTTYSDARESALEFVALTEIW